MAPGDSRLAPRGRDDAADARLNTEGRLLVAELEARGTKFKKDSKGGVKETVSQLVEQLADRGQFEEEVRPHQQRDIIQSVCRTHSRRMHTHA